MASFVTSTCFLIFLMVIMFSFYTKKHIDKLENNIFSWLMISNCIGIIFQIISYIVTILSTNVNSIYYYLFVKVIFSYYLIFEFLFVLYVYVIASRTDKNNIADYNKYKKIKKVLMYLGIISSFIVFLLPINIVVSDKYYYPEGGSLIYIFVLASIGVLYIIYCIIKNRSKIFTKR